MSSSSPCCSIFSSITQFASSLINRLRTIPIFHSFVPGVHKSFSIIFIDLLWSSVGSKDWLMGSHGLSIVEMCPSLTKKQAPLFNSGTVSTMPFQAHIPFLKEVAVNRYVFCRYFAWNNWTHNLSLSTYNCQASFVSSAKLICSNFLKFRPPIFLG